MHRRTWDAQTKAKIVLQGLHGKPVAELCHEYQVSPALFYQGRDQLLAQAAKAFESQQQTRKEPRLEREKARLKQPGGELILEFKQSDEGLG
jgi:transposase-like protein